VKQLLHPVFTPTTGGISMNAHVLAMLSLLLISFGAARAQDDAVKKEHAKMDGAWQIVSGVENGKPSSDNLVQNLKFVFKGSQLTLAGDDIIAKRVGKAAVKIDAATTPRCIDFELTVKGGAAEDRVLEGIYEWKGDELRICISHQAGNRPSEFESKEGSQRVLFVLKREGK
jgi:uncharacterized protein (TIGR03067 family)